MTELTTYLNKSNTFGGRIYLSDFDSHRSISDIADRILSDIRFDHQCELNYVNRKRRKMEAKNNDN